MVNKYRKFNKQRIEAIKWDGNNTNKLIKFGTIECKFPDGIETFNDIFYPDDFVMEKLKESNKPMVLYISNADGGDVLNIGDYAAKQGAYVYRIPEKDFIDNWVLIEDCTYEEKADEIIEAMQWNDNDDEIKEFIGENGSLDKSKKVFILMNSYGGSMVFKKDYIVKFDDEFFGLPRDFFEEMYREMN